MDLNQKYHSLLQGLENLVACETQAIMTENWHALAEALRLKQDTLKELTAIRGQADFQSSTALEILYRVKSKEDEACRALEFKLEEAHKAIEQNRKEESAQRLETVKDIVKMHSSNARAVVVKGS